MPKQDSQPAGQITLRVDYGSALAQRCTEAGLTIRQTQVLAYVCTGVDDEAIATALRISPQAVRDALRCAVRKLAPERTCLDYEDRRAILDAALGRRDLCDDPMEGFHGDWVGPPRVQGMRPFGATMHDLREKHGPARELLGVVCGLTGTPVPPLRLRKSEAPRRRKSRLNRHGQYVAVEA